MSRDTKNAYSIRLNLVKFVFGCTLEPQLLLELSDGVEVFRVAALATMVANGWTLVGDAHVVVVAGNAAANSNG